MCSDLAEDKLQEIKRKGGAILHSQASTVHGTHGFHHTYSCVADDKSSRAANAGYRCQQPSPVSAAWKLDKEVETSDIGGDLQIFR
jgi:hypothetical protein